MFISSGAIIKSNSYDYAGDYIKICAVFIGGKNKIKDITAKRVKQLKKTKH